MTDRKHQFVHEWLRVIKNPDSRALVRSVWSDIQQYYDVREVRKKSGTYVVITDKDTGRVVERRCKASREQCYRDALAEMVESQEQDAVAPPEQAGHQQS